MMRRRDRGQISVMIAIMISTFLLFFAFVINTGMLVNAKINLQNAADLAAYAGAATQARQLNQISFLNYEMRRQWKKMLFRIYVIGNMAQQGFPRGPGTGPMEYIPDLSSNVNYGMPATCVIFNQDDNYCQISTLPPISIPNNGQPTGLDSVTDTLISELKNLETIRQNNCNAIGLTNKLLNLYWLYSTTPTLQSSTGLLGSGPSAVQNRTLQIIQGLTQGLGIVPRDMILRYRISTLNSYINSPAQTGLNISNVVNLVNTDAPLYERAIKAFYSAYYSLGNHTFNGEITLDELLPGNNSASTLLLLKDIKANFDIYSIDMSKNGGTGSVAPSGTSQACTAALLPISLKGLTVGVAKDPTIMTYYALRLKAQAQILFSPFGTLELKAYAAAQPFGSRIGPQNPQFTSENATGTYKATVPGQNILPNLPVIDVDSASKGHGWDTKLVLGKMITTLPSQGQSIGAADLNSAYLYAMAPNPWEYNQYNIINDLGGDSFVQNFEPNSQLASFWAPVFPESQQSALRSQIRQDVDAIFQSSQETANAGNSGGGMDGIRQSLMNGLETYISSTLTSPTGGENNETLHVVRLQNPLQGAGSIKQIPADGTVVTADPNLLRTSWNSVNDANIQSQGRVGYSVKFVSFHSIMKKATSTDGAHTLTNVMATDAEADSDLPLINH